MARARIRSIRIPPRGREGQLPFGGVREDQQPDKIGLNEAELCQGLLIGDGSLDGNTPGTGANLNANAMAFDLYNPTPWHSSNGKNYILGYTSAGKIAYTASDWSDWPAAVDMYVETADSGTPGTAGTPLTFENGITGGPHVRLCFIVRGNGDVLVSNGIDTVYRITGETWPNSLHLKTVAMADIGPFIFGAFLCGMTVKSDGEIIQRSAPTAPDRFYSLPIERTTVPPVYDDNHWAAPAAPGASGFITNIIPAGDTALFVSTSNGIYWYGLEADANGMTQENIITLVDGAGCPSGACRYYAGIFTFESDYNGGAWMALSRAALGPGMGTPVDIEARNGWRLYELAPGLCSTLKLLRASNFKVISCGADSQADFERVAANQRSGIDTANDSGWMWINPSKKIAWTSGAALYRIRTGSGVTVYWDAAHGYAKVYDDDPNWGNQATAYSDISKYGVLITGIPYTNTTLVLAGFADMDGNYLALEYSSTGVSLSSLASTWQHFVLNRPFNSPSVILFMATFSWWVGDQLYSGDIYFPISFGSIKTISAIHVFDFQLYASGASLLIGIGEIRFEGSDYTSVLYVDDIRKVTGLTASSNLEFGRLLSGLRKVDDVYYPQIAFRLGKSATLDTLYSTTLSAAVTAGDDHFHSTAALTIAQPGDPVTIESETVYIKSLDTAKTNITICGTFAAGHLITTALTVKGTAAASTNWSAWTALPLASLYAGYQLNTVLYAVGGAVKTDASGYLWIQTRVLLELDPKSGNSPAVDWWRFLFLAGTLPLSNHFIHQGPDNKLLLSAPAGPSSTENDQVLVYDPKARGATTIAGMHLCAMIQSGKTFLARTGRKMASLFTGNYNYVGTTGTHTPLRRRWRSADLGRGYLRAVRAFIHSYNRVNDAIAADVTMGTGYDGYLLDSSAAATPTATWDRQGANYAAEWINDALYFLTYTGATYTVNLVKIKNGVRTEQVLYTGEAPGMRYGYTMCQSGTLLHIFIGTSGATTGRYVIAKTFDTTTDTVLATDSTTLDCGSGYVTPWRGAMQAITYGGNVYLFTIKRSGSGAGQYGNWLIGWKLSGGTWTAIINAIPSFCSTNTITFCVYENKAGLLELILTQNGGALTQFAHRTYDGTTWGTETTVAVPSDTLHHPDAISDDDHDYWVVCHTADQGVHLYIDGVLHATIASYAWAYFARLDTNKIALFFLSYSLAQYQYLVITDGVDGAAANFVPSATHAPNATTSCFMAVRDDINHLHVLLVCSSALNTVWVYQIVNTGTSGTRIAVAIYAVTENGRYLIDSTETAADDFFLPAVPAAPALGYSRKNQIEIETYAPLQVGYIEAEILED